jgi:hypothetical protein
LLSTWPFFDGRGGLIAVATAETAAGPEGLIAEKSRQRMTTQSQPLGTRFA